MKIGKIVRPIIAPVACERFLVFQTIRRRRIFQPLWKRRLGYHIRVDPFQIACGRTERAVRLDVTDMCEERMALVGFCDVVQGLAGDPLGLRQFFGKRQNIRHGSASRVVCGFPFVIGSDFLYPFAQIDLVTSVLFKGRDFCRPDSCQNVFIMFRMVLLDPVQPLAAAAVFSDVRHIESVLVIV